MKTGIPLTPDMIQAAIHALKEDGYHVATWRNAAKRAACTSDADLPADWVTATNEAKKIEARAAGILAELARLAPDRMAEAVTAYSYALHANAS
jgi:hypothetical protein